MKIFGIVLTWFFLELGCFIAFSEEFGFWTLVGEILISGVFGVFLLFSSLSGSSEAVIELLRGARKPEEILASNLIKILGAILLIIPGILTDTLGLLLQFGIFDHALASFLSRSTLKKKGYSQEIIEAEIIEEKERIQK